MADITKQEFINAVTSSGFPCPTNEQYNYFMGGLGRAGITTRTEAAMFLAQLLHESGGLIHRSEIGGPARDYHLRDWNPEVPVPGQLYYGRGYIQLTYASNYRAASRWLGHGDLLLRNPDLVAQREDYGACPSTTGPWKLGRKWEVAICSLDERRWPSMEKWRAMGNMKTSPEIDFGFINVSLRPLDAQVNPTRGAAIAKKLQFFCVSNINYLLNLLTVTKIPVDLNN